MSALQSETIFALDIGTRSVIGIVVQKEKQTFHIVDYKILEHKERSMLDGQIHDVLAVSDVIQHVKDSLEEATGIRLTHASVAAAGRSLKTKTVRIEQSIAAHPAITQEDTAHLELQAVQLAQKELAEELKHDDPTNFYCVGYSVIHYFLDQEPIGSLIDQRGTEVAVEVIATFLPRVVIDSLISSLHRAGLEMSALTLEPIAAIHVLIPPTMRRLNVALVDIGAGTSDIAITSDGTITAYGMVPFAGDEITDALSQHYLLDFPVAEQLKRNLRKQEFVQVEDILGFEQTLPAQEVLSTIESSIQHLAQKICEEIVRLNGKTPQAVMLIGGGSLTPEIEKWVSEFLGLPLNRVGIRGLQANQHLDLRFSPEIAQNGALSGPEAVTPLGIALAAEHHPVKHRSVTVNEQAIRLFDLRKLTVSDAILASGIPLHKLHGKPGLALGITVNNQLKLIPGGHGVAPKILKNGKPSSLQASIQENDQISVTPGTDGQDARISLEELLQEVDPFLITLNGQATYLAPIIHINGQQIENQQEIKEKDDVQINFPQTLQEVLEQLQVNIKQHLEPYSAQVSFNGESFVLQNEIPPILVNGKQASLEYPIKRGDAIQLEKAPASTFLFHDIFRYTDAPIHQPTLGKTFVLRVNGTEASFDTPIQDGDELELVWE